MSTGTHSQYGRARGEKDQIPRPVGLKAEASRVLPRPRAFQGPSSIASQIQSRCRVLVPESPSPSPLPSPWGRGDSRQRPVPVRTQVQRPPLLGHLQNRTEDKKRASGRPTNGEGFSLSPRERVGVRGNKTCEGHKGCCGCLNACKVQDMALRLFPSQERNFRVVEPAGAGISFRCKPSTDARLRSGVAWG